MDDRAAVCALVCVCYRRHHLSYNISLWLCHWVYGGEGRSPDGQEKKGMESWLMCFSLAVGYQCKNFCFFRYDVTYILMSMPSIFYLFFKGFFYNWAAYVLMFIPNAFFYFLFITGLGIDIKCVEFYERDVSTDACEVYWTCKWLLLSCSFYNTFKVIHNVSYF